MRQLKLFASFLLLSSLLFSSKISAQITIDGNPGFEAFENDGKHATLWVMIAKRYFLQIELQNQDPKELQEWVKRIDLKKLAAIK